MASAKIGVIGGSGLYQIEGLTDIEEIEIDTPFGQPSDNIIVGQLEGQSVAFLPRHGRGHRISPTDVPYRANIYALKSLGVEWVMSVSAVGSMKEEIEPLDIVVPDQLFDRTTKRVSTFFGDNSGIVAHIGFAEPFDPDLRGLLLEEARQVGAREVHDGGVYICMEGPQFSTKGESNIYRSWGVSVIGMTALPEAKLAREAEMRYATLAMATDYDCWYEGHDSVTVEMVVNNLQQNVGRAKEIVRRVVARLATYEPHNFEAVNALATAIMTEPAKIPAASLQKYQLLIGKYFKE